MLLLRLPTSDAALSLTHGNNAYIDLTITFVNTRIVSYPLAITAIHCKLECLLDENNNVEWIYGTTLLIDDDDAASNPHRVLKIVLSSKRSVILDDEGNKSRRRLLIEKRVRRGYIGAKHRKNVLF